MRPGISFWKGETELFSFRARGRQAGRGINLGDFDFLAAEGGEGNVWWEELAYTTAPKAGALTSNFERHVWNKKNGRLEMGGVGDQVRDGVWLLVRSFLNKSVK